MTIREWLKNIPQDILENIEKTEESTFSKDSYKLFFKNKTVLSMVWHAGSYTSKTGIVDPFSSLDIMFQPGFTNDSQETDSNDVEIAWWFVNGPMQSFKESNDTVLGYISISDLEKWCRAIMVKSQINGAILK
jgi:hypothetical protein